MNKKLLSILLVMSIVLSLFGVTASAYYGEDGKTYKDGAFTYSLDENGNASITDCSDKSSKKITIPSEVGSHNVKNVSIAGVIKDSKAEEIVFSEGIETLEGYGLTEEWNVKKIWLPKSLVKMDNGTFSDWLYTKMKDVYYAGTPLDWCKVDILGNYADQDNCGLELATMHYNNEEDYVPEWEGKFEYVLDGKEAVLTDCSDIHSKKIVIPDTLGGCPVVAVANHVFDCHYADYNEYKKAGFMSEVEQKFAELEEDVLPETVRIIGSSAFENCAALKKINFPESLDWIGAYTFDSTGLTELNLPDTMSKIGQCSFSFTNIADVVVPYGIEVLEGAAFATGNLTSLKLSQTVKTAEGIFDLPSGGEHISIYIPKGIEWFTSIGAYTTDVDIYYEGSEDEWKNIGTYGSMDEFSIYTIHYNCEMDYAVEEVKEDGKDYTYIETTDKVIVTDFDKTASGEVEIPEEINGKPITEIGNEAFKDCTDITGITLPSTVEKIGQSAFENSGIKRFVVPEKVENIESKTFYHCQNLESVEIPVKVRSIETQAFEKCDNLTDVYYSGTAEDWDKISIADGENSVIANAENHLGKTMPRNDKILVVMLVVMLLLALMAGVIVIIMIKIKRRAIK